MSFHAAFHFIQFMCVLLVFINVTLISWYPPDSVLTWVQITDISKWRSKVMWDGSLKSILFTKI